MLEYAIVLTEKRLLPKYSIVLKSMLQNVCMHYLLDTSQVLVSFSCIFIDGLLVDADDA